MYILERNCFRRPEYRLSTEGSKAQLERWRDLELDWRQVRMVTTDDNDADDYVVSGVC